jgi:hypothetical protein
MIGGPYASSEPEALLPLAEHVVVGDPDEIFPEIAADLERGSARRLYSITEKPDVSRTPVPRFDLLALNKYTFMSVQFSRGCPFTCEFCDIITIYGRRPRTKSPAQLIGELDALLQLGWRKGVFVVDDNFIGNHKAALELAQELERWQRRNRYPFEFFTEASIDLASRFKRANRTFEVLVRDLADYATTQARDRRLLKWRPGTDSEEKMGASGARSREKDWKVLRGLRLRCSGLSLGELRDDTELLHKAQSVPADIGFRYLAVREATNGYSGNGELLPGWRNPVEVTFMSTATGPTGHYCFAFGNDVLDRQTKVGESSTVESYSLLFTLRAAPRIGCRSVMVFVVGGEEFVCQRQIALVPNFFNQTTDNSFVIF